MIMVNFELICQNSFSSELCKIVFISGSICMVRANQSGALGKLLTSKFVSLSMYICAISLFSKRAKTSPKMYCSKENSAKFCFKELSPSYTFGSLLRDICCHHFEL